MPTKAAWKPTTMNEAKSLRGAGHNLYSACWAASNHQLIDRRLC
jgi:hypothetical protein